jgi:hypothetical protein
MTYPDGSFQPVRVPYQGWPSAHIIGNVAYILLKEVMGYSTVLFDTTTILSEQVVNYVAGCLDPDDPLCAERDVQNPKVHFTLETWEGGQQRAINLPENIRPDLLSVLSYNLVDQWYIWLKEIDDGMKSHPPLVLDYYRSYYAKSFTPAVAFDSWRKLLDLLPSKIIVRCSDMTADSWTPRNVDKYIQLTNDTSVECHHNDSVWFSPACRSNTSECIPLLIPYNVDFAMQISFFLNMPLAVVVAIGDGYYDAIQKGRFLFGWYQPSDDPLLDASGKFPVLLNLPPANQLEIHQGIYRTGFAQFKPFNYGWRDLQEVDQLVHFLASNVDLGDQDWDQLMSENRRLKAIDIGNL